LLCPASEQDELGEKSHGGDILRNELPHSRRSSDLSSIPVRMNFASGLVLIQRKVFPK
jgi:hypothetical protein